LITPANARTNQFGNALYSEDIDLQNLRPEEIGNKFDIWEVKLDKAEKTTIQDLIDNSNIFNFLASYVGRHEGYDLIVKSAKCGAIKEITTSWNIYRCKGHQIFIKNKKVKK
jgi:hypothetical protein